MSAPSTSPLPARYSRPRPLPGGKQSDDAGIAELQALAEALCRRDLSDAEAGEYDRRFHLTIARLSGNPVVEFFVQQIWHAQRVAAGNRSLCAGLP